MEDYVSNSHHRKRRRRRRSDKPAISAHLVLDDPPKEDIGILSEDLYTEFFPASQTALGLDQGEDEQVRHVAVSPWSPTSATSTEDGTWTIIPVRAAPRDSAEPKHLARSTVYLSPSSPALQCFLQAFHAAAPTRIANRSKSGFEVLILDVVPLELDTIFAAVEGELLKNMDEVHSRFGGGFGTNHSSGTTWKGKGKATAVTAPYRSKQETRGPTEEERLMIAIRQALASPKVVHSGALLSLPLPSHPITHVPPPPAKITLCEPVSQGLLRPSTRIVVTKSYPRSSGSRR
ncbi:MAG: peroxisomal assembly protein, partial [Pleopsidium flavum]